MLIKEYRISLPMSVEEYRIAQLYMIQKKSREESHGAGSGVEILQNQPYKEGPGGSGQYTYKIYHIGSHLPGWFRAILPKSALRVEEEAWNAYPYTKTRYRCPFVEKFYLEIETKYLNDGGERDNVFNLGNSEMKDRIIDYLDIVKDPISSGDYKKEEDPKIYQSKTTKRGPLNDNWRQEYCEACKDPINKTKKIMTAYKLCRVEFKYWGMQNKIERFIHDIGLRKTMLRAHRQAWCWQDEYHGLELSDIRRLERETQLALQQTMADAIETDEIEYDNKSTNNIIDNTDINKSSPHIHLPKQKSHEQVRMVEHQNRLSPASSQHSTRSKTSHRSLQSTRSKSSLDSSQISDWRFQSLEQLQESSSDEDDEFFDAQDFTDSAVTPPSDSGLEADADVFVSDFESSDSEESDTETAWENVPFRSSSMETLTVSNDEFADARSVLSSESEMHVGRRLEKLCQKYSLETGLHEKQPPPTPLCKTNTLFLVIHGGSLLDSSSEYFNTSKRSDYAQIKKTFELVIKGHYPSAKGHIALRLVPCPQICAETLNVLSSLSPYGFDALTPGSTESNLPWSQEFVPLGAVALFSTCSPEYQDHVNTVVAKANLVYMDFLKSDEGKGFNGQVCILADATGSVMTYDALCRPKSGLTRQGSGYSSHNSLNEESQPDLVSDSTYTLCHSDSNLTQTSSCSHETVTEETIKLKQDSVKSNSDDGVKLKADSVILKELSVKLDKEDSIKITKDEGVANSQECIMRHPESRQDSIKLHITRSVDDTSGRRTSTGSEYERLKFDFEVVDFFMLGSPLGLVLAYRRLYAGDDKMATPVRPDCQQMYNLFHTSDPSALRLEPLVNYMFKQIPPIKIARYNRFPMGDGESLHLVETICHYLHLFSEQFHSAGASPSLLLSLQRQASVTSTCSQLSGLSSPDSAFTSIVNISSKWWGNKRLDYMLYCPEVLHSFPVRALPPLFHASFWESTDVAAFVLRQVMRQDELYEDMTTEQETETTSTVTSLDNQPKEKWLKKRTMYKVKNLQPNHRGNDVLVLEDKPQVLTAKFMYGPLDMTSLSGEKTDIHVMSPSGEWSLMGTEVTDGHGRLHFTIPRDKQLSLGIHPVKMVVRVDHTTLDMFLAVLPPKTETVIFSIDGSFTASVSIMGKDPKVKPGAVDVVRHWQELGYLILYVTARPDLQHNKVVGWLAQHNFPHGMVVFMDGFSKEPIRQKIQYLKHLQHEADLVYAAGYGSAKDINGYRELGLAREKIFIVGKSNKKQQNLATFIPSGYAIHLEQLMIPGASRPASGNAKHMLRKSCFNLPAPNENKRSSKNRPDSSTLRSNSIDIPGFMRQESGVAQTLITVDESGNTLLQPIGGGTGRPRGVSPRPKIAFEPPR